ncbi:MAG: tryptophan synthase subunit alpha [Spirochaetes bacterium]|nr:tryptophan synthase subunit alpha [Spirochaetota bacterium]
MKHFLAYIPAGYPDLKTTERILLELKNVPITGVEIGVPFSDPVADGPVIQKAYTQALKKKINLKLIFQMLERLDLPYDLYLMSYLNPILNYGEGLSKLKVHLKKAKVKGLILPDLPLVEINNIQLQYPVVLFVAPNTTFKEIPLINKIRPPFVYYIARYGVTGTRNDLAYMDHVIKLRNRIKSPLYVGFGISTPAHVKKVWSSADGVIVGSALVKEMDKVKPAQMPKAVVKKIQNLLNR